MEKQTALKKLRTFVEVGGPEEYEYDELTRIWECLNTQEEEKNCGTVTANELLNIFGNDFLYQTIQGHSYRKPHGYAGDFEIIDNIYQGKTNNDIKFQKWDKYLHSQKACKALINRKDYFINLVKDKVSKTNRPLRILNIASGPCRDVLELFEQVPHTKMHIHCIDVDADAITYAKRLLGCYSNTVEFTQRNIFKFNTIEKFDLIWSGGLFDYFTDSYFIALLSKVYSWLAKGGELAIGNFSISNPSRAYMEKANDWHLFHRTSEELTRLALEAGLQNEQIRVGSEALGVNLFLHVKAI